jgi:hypothetical protein
MIEGLKPPPHSGLIREARVLLELARLMVRFRDLARQPHGNGEPVLVLPGYGAGDITTALLQGYLRFLGYRVRGWARAQPRRSTTAVATCAQTDGFIGPKNETRRPPHRMEFWRIFG